MLPSEMKSNLLNCVKDMVPLRLYQAEKMVLRSTMDSTILTSDATVSHVEFRRDMIGKYIFECKPSNMAYYVYSLLEVLCYQCGFFSWDQIRE